ncbi:MAG: lipoprotein [Anaeromicrobium sp.]|jgi:hypothetical protein|uniref:lipoprotein n=1 Tax=Anaeromicrobium sp. TaxID=1929132 RepID=UPI0025D3B636|nr:lipoprotein [Anaeromicrobium sp.]MCT4595882.1 lipoprotein [Anaeromicrobium sp.]
MRRVTIYILLILLLSGCSSDSVQNQPYKGNSLVIGVIGEVPVIREDNVEFKSMRFSDLKKVNELSSKYNAIFIMKEHFDEASKLIYAKVYKNSGVPFFFIDSLKSYTPFVIEELSYESCDKSYDQTYATGYFQSGNKWRYWGYGLYNDKRNEANIQDVYSRIFHTIDTEIK